MISATFSTQSGSSGSTSVTVVAIGCFHNPSLLVQLVLVFQFRYNLNVFHKIIQAGFKEFDGSLVDDIAVFVKSFFRFSKKEFISWKSISIDTWGIEESYGGELAHVKSLDRSKKHQRS